MVRLIFRVEGAQIYMSQQRWNEMTAGLLLGTGSGSSCFSVISFEPWKAYEVLLLGSLCFKGGVDMRIYHVSTR